MRLQRPVLAHATSRSERAEPLSPPERAKSLCHPERAESLCHPERAESLCHPERAESLCHPERAKSLCHPERAESLCHPERAKSLCHPERAKRVEGSPPQDRSSLGRRGSLVVSATRDDRRMITLDGESLTIAQLVRLARDGEEVGHDPRTDARVKASEALTPKPVS